MRVVLIFLVVTVPEWFLKWWILSIHLDNYFLDLLTTSLMSRLRKIEVKQCQSWGWVPRSQKMHLLGSVQSIDPLEFLYICTFAVCCPVHASLWFFQPFPVFSISMDPSKFSKQHLQHANLLIGQLQITSNKWILVQIQLINKLHTLHFCNFSFSLSLWLSMTSIQLILIISLSALHYWAYVLFSILCQCEIMNL